MIFEKNLFTTWICTRDLMLESQLRYQMSCLFCGFQRMLLEFSPLLRLQLTAERNLITTLTCDDKPEVGR